MASEKKLILLLLSFFVLSRLPFINSAAVFFDSGEYLRLFALPNFFQALYSGHFPLHIGYIILGWPIFHLAQFLKINPGNAVVIEQIIIQTLAIYCFYKFVEFISNKKTALFSAIFISITPLFWITNTTIMMETAYLSFFCISLYFLTKYLSKNNNLNLHLSALFLTLATLTHLLVILWIPFYLSIIFLKNKERFPKSFVILSSYLLIFSVINIFMISKTLAMEPFRVTYYLYLSKQQEFALANPSFHTFLISIRNFIVPLFANFTGLLVILGSISLFKEIKNKSKIALLAFLWIAPAFVANQWWDSLLPGRHSLITAFGFSLLAAYLLKNKPKLTFLLVLYLLIVSIPTLNLLRKPVPYLEEASATISLPKNSLLIETHFARPQIQDEFRGRLFSVNEGGSENKVINETIKNYLRDNKPVFISSGALSEPYGLYAGPYLHSLTLSYLHKYQLEDVIKNYTLKRYQIINEEDNLSIYQIVSANPSQYPKAVGLKNSMRRIDYFDPISRALTSLITK